MKISRQSTRGQLELPVSQRLAGTDNLVSVNQRPAGTDYLAPDNQRLPGTGSHGLGGLLPADTRHMRLAA